MRALRVLSTAALLASFAGGCTRTRDPEPGRASADRAPARWRQVAVAPPRREHDYHREELVFSDWDHGDPGFLVHDLGGGRWFFPCAAAGAPLGLPRVQRSFPTSRGQLRLDDRAKTFGPSRFATRSGAWWRAAGSLSRRTTDERARRRTSKRLDAGSCRR